MSDRRAIHDTVAAIKAGTNVELDWAPQYYTQEIVTDAIDSGQVTEGDVDNLLHPRYVKMIEFGHMDEPFDRFKATCEARELRWVEEPARRDGRR
ncbi:MAG: glycosyl hydrolase [Cryobacterium sp.]|nr:glycosyl hydrolase [Cryobacterium sp.]